MASKKIMVDIMVVDKNATRTINQTSKAVDGLAKSTEQLAGRTSKNKAETGLNNALLMETGRLASDASYGFQGMANNLGQVVSLLQISAKNSGGFVASLRDLGRSLMGVGGIMVGVQLLISFLPRLQKAFEGTSAKAKRFAKELEKISEGTEKTKEELEAYFTVLTDYNISQERRSNLEQQIIDKLPDIKNLNTKSKEGIDDLRDSIDLYVKQQMIRAEIDLLLEENADSFLEDRKRRDVLEKVRLAKSQKEQIDIIKENTNIFERLSIEMMGADGKGLIARLIEGDRYETTNLIKGFEDFVNKEGSGVVAAKDRIAELTAQLIGYSKSSGGANARTREFKEGLFDISKFILEYRKQAEKMSVLNEQQKIDLEEDFAKREADRRLGRFIEQQKKRLEEYKEQVKGRKDAGKLIANAEKELNDSIEDAKEKHGNAVLAIEDAFITKRILLADKEARLTVASERKIEDMQLNSLKERAGANEVYYNAKLAQVNSDIELDALALATTKMNLKEELRLRENLVQNQILLNQLSTQSEVSKLEEQKRVNMEYVGFAQGISRALSGIAGENEAIQKAALVFEKGAAIASIIVKAQTSIATSRAATSAANLNATMTYPYPFNLPIIAQNEALFLKNTALTKTGAGIGIAAILATAIGRGGSIDGASGNGGAGGGSAVQAPDFNVVGASETSQLGMALGRTQKEQTVNLVYDDLVNFGDKADRTTNVAVI